ncbi:MAG: hypothetical protein AAGB93_24975 [Planctomycetota bacterium]
MRTSIATICLGLLAACTSTQHEIENEQLGEAWDGRPRANLLVVGLYEEQTDRVSIESVLAARLTAQGVTASPSYSVLPDLAADADAIARTIAGGGYDGVLTMATLEGGEQFDYEAHQEAYAMVRLLGSEGTFTRLGGYADQAAAAQHLLDFGLFDAKTLEPLWNATTDSREADTGAAGIERLSDWLVGELRSRSLVP